MHLIYTPKWEIIIVVIIYFHISCHKWSEAWPIKTHFLKWKKSDDQFFNIQPKAIIETWKNFLKTSIRGKGNCLKSPESVVHPWGGSRERSYSPMLALDMSCD